MSGCYGTYVYHENNCVTCKSPCKIQYMVDGCDNIYDGGGMKPMGDSMLTSFFDDSNPKFNDFDMIIEDGDTIHYYCDMEQYQADKQVKKYGLPRIKYPLYRKGSKYYGKKRKTN